MSTDLNRRKRALKERRRKQALSAPRPLTCRSTVSAQGDGAPEELVFELGTEGGLHVVRRSGCTRCDKLRALLRRSEGFAGELQLQAETSAIRGRLNGTLSAARMHTWLRPWWRSTDPRLQRLEGELERLWQECGSGDLSYQAIRRLSAAGDRAEHELWEITKPGKSASLRRRLRRRGGE